MKKMKIVKIRFLMVWGALVFLSACGGSSGGKSSSGVEKVQASENIPAVARYSEDGKRIITIGTWYDRYYVSKHTDIYDDPNLAQPHTAQIRLDRMREIEKKYNVILKYVNLTFDGLRESINTSIPAGNPDVDIYEVDLQFGIPAVLKGYGLSLEGMNLAGTDVFGSQTAMKYLGLAGQKDHYLFTPARTGGTNAYVLAFNMDMIRAAGLPNPQDLYDRKEWTWDKWREYLLALTKDRDNDGITDVYGFSGYWTYLLANLLFSNGTGIAPGAEEKLSSPATVEVLEFIYNIYNVDKTARPWDRSNWEINNRLYAEGLSGFWVGADWIFNEQGNLNLPFEIGVVPWPQGPNGSFEENRHSQPQGNWYFIPKGVAEPRLVYDVIFDWINWYEDNPELGADTRWSRNMYMTDRNFAYASMMASKPGFDIWDSLDIGFTLTMLLSGEIAPREIVDEYRQAYQDALDRYFQ
jgi:hypothetical protein